MIQSANYLNNGNFKAKAEKEEIGGLAPKSLYKDNKVPGIIYGGKDQPQPIYVQKNELLKIISNEGLFNSIVEIEIESKKENVVFKEVQKHPSKNVFTHIDLQRVCKRNSSNCYCPCGS